MAAAPHAHSLANNGSVLGTLLIGTIVSLLGSVPCARRHDRLALRNGLKSPYSCQQTRKVPTST